MSDDTMPPVGNFRKEDLPATPRGSFAAPPPATSPSPPPVAKPAEVATASTAKSVGELYLERLRKENIDLETATGIYDAVLAKGFYMERFPLSKTRSFVLRTRLYDDTHRLRRAVEVAQPNSDGFAELYRRHMIAASLHEYCGQVLKRDGDADAALASRLAFVDTLPEQSIVLLSRALDKFDKRITTIFSEGCEEVF